VTGAGAAVGPGRAVVTAPQPVACVALAGPLWTGLHPGRVGSPFTRISIFLYERTAFTYIRRLAPGREHPACTNLFDQSTE